MKGSKIYLYGKHALTEALKYAPHAVRKVFVAPEMRDKELQSTLAKAKVLTTTLKRQTMSTMLEKNAAHQGVVAEINSSALLEKFDVFIARLHPTKDTALLLLDELTDPHNIGTIIRSAAAFGIAGVILPERNQSSITGAVTKTSAGMVFRLPLISVPTSEHALHALKKKGFRMYGLAMKGSRDVSEEKFDTPTVFVVGNESRGLKPSTRSFCDAMLRVKMHPRCESLNAAVSAAIVLHHWSLQHVGSMR